MRSNFWLTPMSNKSYSDNSVDDETLFALCKQQDKDAFSAIYYRYHKYLYALAMRFLKDSDMAEDAVQQVFVKLWEIIQEVDIEINVKNYLYSMTKNHILNQFRKYRDTISINYAHAQVDISDTEADIYKAMEDAELSDWLVKGINSLPKQKKEICHLKINENLSNQEIADQTGLSVNTVKSHYQEAVKMLRVYFKQIKMLIF